MVEEVESILHIHKRVFTPLQKEENLLELMVVFLMVLMLKWLMQLPQE